MCSFLSLENFVKYVRCGHLDILVKIYLPYLCIRPKYIQIFVFLYSYTYIHQPATIFIQSFKWNYRKFVFNYKKSCEEFLLSFSVSTYKFWWWQCWWKKKENWFDDFLMGGENVVLMVLGTRMMTPDDITACKSTFSICCQSSNSNFRCGKVRVRVLFVMLYTYICTYIFKINCFELNYLYFH